MPGDNGQRRDTPWQEEFINALDSSSLKKLAVVAPTGSGKTELALYWVKRLKELGLTTNKLLYILPLRTALNQMFSRLIKYFGEENVGLLHSTALIEYAKLEEGGDRRRARNYYVQYKLAEQLIPPVMLATPDQLLLISLKYYLFDKIYAMAPYLAIVVDEIQAYDPKMLAIIVRSLRMLSERGAKILIITATLPPYAKDILENNGFKVKDVSNLDLNVKNKGRRRHKVDVVEENLGKEKQKYESYNRKIAEKVVEVLRNRLNEWETCNMKKVLVIVNDVFRCMTVYEKVRNEFSRGGYKVYLLHNRMLEKEKESVIEEAQKDDKIILVATQVVEASVDIDFDVLITEASPIDSQIQRWGRIYRNRDIDYDKDVSNIIILFYTLGNDNSSQVINEETVKELGVYRYDLVMRSIDIVKNKDEVLNYEEEIKLLEEVYSNVTQDFKQDYEKYFNLLEGFRVRHKSEAQKVFRDIDSVQVLPLPKSCEDIESLGDELSREYKKIIKCIKSMDENISGEYENCDEGDIDRRECLKHVYLYSQPLPTNRYRSMLEKKLIREVDRWGEMHVVVVESVDDFKEVFEKGLEYLLYKSDDRDEA